MLFSEFFWSPRIYFLAVAAGAALVAVGGYLLWEDFLAPALGIKSSGNERAGEVLAAPTVTSASKP